MKYRQFDHYKQQQILALKHFLRGTVFFFFFFFFVMNSERSGIFNVQTWTTLSEERC